jgi:ankyrin repeat protein
MLTRLLFESGADINARSSSGETAFFMAAKAGQTAIVRLFLDKGISVHEIARGYNSPLAVAAGEGHLEVVKVLIEYGSIPERLSPRSFDAALARAVKLEQEEIVAFLIENGKMSTRSLMDLLPQPCIWL